MLPNSNERFVQTYATNVLRRGAHGIAWDAPETAPINRALPQEDGFQLVMRPLSEPISTPFFEEEPVFRQRAHDTGNVDHIIDPMECAHLQSIEDMYNRMTNE